MKVLSGHRVLLTGASRGLGRALAEAFAREGAQLALWARDVTALEETRQAALAAGADESSVRVYVADLANASSLEAAAAATLADFGAVDVLVNNAALQGPLGRIETLNWEAWQAVFQVNLFAAARLSQIVIPAMRAQRRGKIINLSGGGATGPRPDVTAYAASKAALVRLSETLAEELRDAHVDVNCVAPGAMNTRMLDELLAAGPTGARAEYEKALRQAQAGGTPPDKAAALIVFLASAASDGISGRLISAVWDDWERLTERRDTLAKSDIYTLRRIVPKDRGMDWE